MQFTLFSENQPKTFKVLRRLLTTYVPSWSRFLPRAGADPITITDTSVKSFETFLGWLRFQYYYCKDDKSCPWNRKTGGPRWDLMDDNGTEYFDVGDPIMWGKKPHDVDFLADHAEAAVEMCIFAIRYEIPRLRLDAIDRLVWCLNRFGEAVTDCREFEYIGTAAFVTAYGNISLEDPIRSILCESFSEISSNDPDMLSEMPKALLVDALYIGWERGLGVNSLRWTPCDYHGHANLEEKGACKIRVRMQRGMNV
jgi:hypothetical protein